MRILVRTSKLAIWARRLALFAAALILISAGLHYFGQITADVFEISLAIGTVCGALAFLIGIAAYVRLWFTGDRGWGPASVGFFLGLVCLAPAGMALTLSEIYPSTADVTTALVDPPQLVEARPNESEIDSETVLASFPNLITRIYQLPPETLFSLGQSLARANGWEILSSTPPTETSTGQLNALRHSLLGFENEIAFRVAPNPIGALIDLRAASLHPVYHDLGDNGRAIEAFLLALDDRVSTYIQNNMAQPVPDQLPVPQTELAPGEETDAQ
ncbi:DUF1499 domain-containing protein [Pelagibacterium flavum]|uniref:DUF1499 domain-containing protein n=1 Tax=Pelagibacterium flavum TaxID=2984530 RepID=A0ABY6ILG8_9HYPH|nr:DUF1499 domain-containing protein [Pelagibacterium sp. YIM 151497]UYQ71423.1 DUF1499 domain-containing protein [Pelagibacterium sp. YIM 151497]|tara:strand:- start:684 stop:1502 length:819 start_codon:yes stop_codon:yes gene_type:complete